VRVSAVDASGSAGRVYRSYARLAAAAFALVVLYTLAVKVPGGELARDWTHTALHVVTGCVAAYVGWIPERATPAKALTGALALGYGTLGLFGWFTEGVLMGSPFRIPLEAPDNVFHLVLGSAAVLTVAVASVPAGRRFTAVRRSR
jgi:hypothetical protein